MDVCSTATGIPKEHLKVSKKMGASGFKRDGRIIWPEFEPWWNANKAIVQEHTEDNLTVWKTRKTKAEALINEKKLEELNERYVDKEEIKVLLRQIATAQKATLKSKLLGELPPRLLGLGVVEMTVILDGVVEDLCHIFQNTTLEDEPED